MASWTDLLNSPHAEQGDGGAELAFARSLCSKYPRKEYHRRKDELKSVIHWGQRKLLLSEIEFLLLADKPRAVVIYAGAAPGTHVKVLSEMFPDLHFILVDPAPFTVKPSRTITLIQDLFTDRLARQLRKRHARRPILFISDVRTGEHGLDTDEIVQTRVENDMRAQEKWYHILEPEKSMLKFKLPYTAGRTRYLDGDLRLPVWGPITTTECRLIVEQDAKSRVYDHKQHEEQMFFFNTVARSSLYEHHVTGVEGLDYCYDCRAEVSILKKYARNHCKRNVNCMIRKLSEKITAGLSNYRTLATPNPDPGQRSMIIRRNQWINGRPAYESMAE